MAFHIYSLMRRKDYLLHTCIENSNWYI